VHSAGCALFNASTVSRIMRRKQASHWHDKRFTPWPAIWRANKERTRNSVRGDAWRCGSGKVVRAMLWRKF